MGTIAMIAAAGENNALGKDNKLMWHLPDDFKRFKDITTGHKMIMGRKTFESFPKPLPNRLHIVITRDRTYKLDHPQCVVVHSLEEALQKTEPEETVFVIGGGEIYELAMDISDVIELTRIHANFEADTYFPEIDTGQWELVKEEYHPEDARHAHAFTYLTYTRK